MAAGLLSLAGTAPAAAAGSAFTTTPLKFTVVTGPKDAPVTCTIVGDLRVPAGIKPGSPAPGAVLATNGFGGNKSNTGPNGNGAYGARFAEQGYVTLSYSGLGFGGSSCNIYVDDPDYDGKAGSQLVSFLGGAKGIAKTTDGKAFDIAGLVRLDKVGSDGKPHANDPRVAMIGGSYGGQIQFAIAGVDPRMDALAPIYTWNDLGYSLSPNNADPISKTAVANTTPGIWKSGWQALFFGLGAAGNVLYPGSDPNLCGDYPLWICRAVAEEATLGYPSAETIARVNQVSVKSYASKIKIPVLFSQGQKDSLFNINEAVATYSTLKAQGNTVRMVWQSWGHTVGAPVPGELDAGTLEPGSADLTKSVQGRIFTDWMARWLKDAPVDLGPAVRYFRDYAYKAPADPKNVPAALAAATSAYASAPSYPVGSPYKLSLSAGNALTAPGEPVKPGTTMFTATGASPPTNSGEAITGGGVPQQDPPGTVARWTSAPQKTPLDIAGIPELSVRFTAPQIAAAQSSSPLGKLMVFAKLYDVDPAGGRTLIKNLVSAARVPDVTKQVRITLPGVVHRFGAGHSVQLVLAASDITYKGGGLGGPVSIVDSPTTPNVLTLPNVSAQAAALRPLARPAAPAAPSGGSLPTTGLPLAPGLLGVLLLLGAAGAIRLRHQAAPRS